MFEGRLLLIATKHGKEKVIAPVFEKELGVKCVLIENFDTDILGTFSGETERKEDAFTTVKKKCILAMEHYNIDLVLASEGSFGSHPQLFMVPCDDEILLLIDTKNKLEISERVLSIETNFRGQEVRTQKELREFAMHAQFPSHALILRLNREENTKIIKDITNWEILLSAFHQFKEKSESVYVETDMRAMNNPTRMKHIEKVAQKLADKINSRCPECATPGFGIVDLTKGLPCESCHYPTNSILSHLYACTKCGLHKEAKYPNRIRFEEAQFCDLCNP